MNKGPGRPCLQVTYCFCSYPLWASASIHGRSSYPIGGFESSTKITPGPHTDLQTLGAFIPIIHRSLLEKPSTRFPATLRSGSVPLLKLWVLELLSQIPNLNSSFIIVNFYSRSTPFSPSPNSFGNAAFPCTTGTPPIAVSLWSGSLQTMNLLLSPCSSFEVHIIWFWHFPLQL